jgi:hypothetical protein
MTAVSRHIYWLLGALGLVYAALFVCSWPVEPGLPGERFTEEQWNQIELGMTHAEVEEILGCAPGDYTRRVSTLVLRSDPSFDPVNVARLMRSEGQVSRFSPPLPDHRAWQGPYGEIHLFLDAKTGRAIAKHWEPHVEPERSPWYAPILTGFRPLLKKLGL